MKTWILNNDLTRSPQAALKMYSCGYKKAKHDKEGSFLSRNQQHFFARKLKSKIKALSKLLVRESIADMERS